MYTVVYFYFFVHLIICIRNFTLIPSGYVTLLILTLERHAASRRRRRRRLCCCIRIGCCRQTDSDRYRTKWLLPACLRLMAIINHLPHGCGLYTAQVERKEEFDLVTNRTIVSNPFNHPPQLTIVVVVVVD